MVLFRLSLGVWLRLGERLWPGLNQREEKKNVHMRLQTFMFDQNHNLSQTSTTFVARSEPQTRLWMCYAAFWCDAHALCTSPVHHIHLTATLLPRRTVVRGWFHHVEQFWESVSGLPCRLRLLFLPKMSCIFLALARLSNMSTTWTDQWLHVKMDV